MKKLKVIIVDPVHPDLVSSLKKKFAFVNYCPDINYSKLSKIIKNYEIIIMRSSLTLDSDLIKKAVSLKIIARAGVGMDNINTIEAKKRNIKFFNIPAKSSHSVAEFAFGLLFSAARKISFCDRLLRDNIWRKKDMYGYEIANKNLGIIGLGKIGSKIVAFGKKFKMNIYANVQNPSGVRKKILKKKGINLTSLNYLLKLSDIIFVAVPLSKKTFNLLNKKNLRYLKKSAIIINISRGGVVNEKHLYEVLKKKKIFAAATDVLIKEKKFNNLFNLNNIVVTSHIGAMTYEAQKRIGVALEKKLFKMI